MRCSFLFCIFITVLVGCSSSPIESTPSHKGKHHIVQVPEFNTPASLCRFESLQRFPASVSCLDFYKNNKIESPTRSIFSFIRQLLTDFSIRSKVAKIKASLKSDGADKSPVSISKIFEYVRENILPIFKLGTQEAESLTRAMETDLRDRSYRYKQQLSFRTETGKANEFDYVIVGGGVHGIISLAKILRNKPDAKVLIVDESDTMGSTFRLLSDVFRLNSSSRPSGPGYKPLPGEGNLNELPELLLQVSELAQGKYPTSGDLGRTLVAAAHAAMNSPNVRVLLSSKVETIGKSKNENLSWSLNTRFSLSEKDVITTIDAANVIIASGLGLPKYPPRFIEFIKKNPEIVKSSAPGKLPKVVTFEDLLRIIATSDNPKKLFEGKKIDIVGTGDSANVLIEFLLGYAPDAAYGNSDGQTPSAKLVRWIGQSVETCEQFIRTARSRYAPIGTGFRSSSPKVPAILKGGFEKAEELFFNEKNNLLLTLEDKSVISDSDLIVVTTGFEGQIHKVLRELYPNVKTDKELIGQLQLARSETSVSGGNITNVGRYIRDEKGGRILLVGPGAGQLASDSELVGIIQNFVSIFNNAPRTVAAVQDLMENQIPSKKTADLPDYKMNLQESAEPVQIQVRGIAATRNLKSAQQSYVTSSLQSFFRDVFLPKNTNETFQLEFDYLRDSGDLLVKSPNRMDIRPIVENMAASKDFLSEVKSLLSPLDGSVKMIVSAEINVGSINSENININYVEPNNVPHLAVLPIIDNAKSTLRGLEMNNIGLLNQSIAAIDATKVDVKIGQRVYYGSELVTVVAQKESSVYSVKYSNGAVRDGIERQYLSVEGNFSGITTGDLVYYGDALVTIVGILPNGSYTVKYTNGTVPFGSAARNSLATPGSFQGVSTGESAYYGENPVQIVGITPEKQFTVKFQNGVIRSGVNIVDLAVKGTFNGISTGDDVYYGRNQVKVVGVTPQGLFTIKYNVSSAARSGIKGEFLAKMKP